MNLTDNLSDLNKYNYIHRPQKRNNNNNNNNNNTTEVKSASLLNLSRTDYDNAEYDNTNNIYLMYRKIKALFEGCDSTIDARHISEAIFLKYPQYRQLIISYRDSLIYPDNIDITTKITSLDSVSNSDTKDDAYTLKNNLISRSNDLIYSKSLERIVNRKGNRYRDYNTINYYKNYVSKSCPHCGENMRMHDSTTYVICGYPDTHKGYNWKGCCNDWCFSCEKFLCKSWEKDNLNIESNRLHDDNCCKNHAKRNEHNYPQDYCHCILNSNVVRNDQVMSFVDDMGF
jgi:hypothetical protein